jgi:hypothetical protein
MTLSCAGRRVGFELLAPSEPGRLQPHSVSLRVTLGLSQLRCMHANSRIGYLGALCRADGADAARVARGAAGW